MSSTINATKAPKLGAKIRKDRERAGFSLSEARVVVCKLLPQSLWVHDETLRRYEKGLVDERKADPVLLSAMAKAYGVPLKSWSDLAVDGSDQVFDLLGEAPPPDGPDGAPPGIRTQNLRLVPSKNPVIPLRPKATPLRAPSHKAS